MNIPISIILTFISLIYGLALAHALSCIAEYIQYKKSLKQYWLWWVWATVIMFLSIGFWVSIYVSWSEVGIPMRGFVLIVIQSFLFYLTIFIFFNHIREMKIKDLKYIFFKYKKYVFLLLFFQYLIIFKGFDLVKDNISIAEYFRVYSKEISLSDILNPFLWMPVLAIIDNVKFHSIIGSLILLSTLIQFIFG